MARVHVAVRGVVSLLSALGLVALRGQACAADAPSDAPPPYPAAPASGAAQAAPGPQEQTPPPSTVSPAPSGPPAAAAPGLAPPPVMAYPPPPGPWVPRPIPSPNPPSEPGLVAGQLALGALTTVGMLVIVAALSEGTNGDGVGSLVVVAMPAAVGFVVCAIGSRSEGYRGGCTPAVLGSYIGLLSAVPLGFLGCSLAGGQGDSGCLGGAVAGLVIGILAGPAVGATVGWHLFKEPRVSLWSANGSQRTAEALVDDSPTGRHAHRGAVAPRLSVPLLSLNF